MKLIKIEANDVEATWPYVKDLLQKPIDRNLGEYSLEDAKKWLVNDQWHLWVIVSETDGIVVAATTQFIDFPMERRLGIFLIGSKKNTMKHWLELAWKEDSPLFEFAKKNAVKRFQGCARDGWIKVSAKLGFKKYYTVLIKDIK